MYFWVGSQAINCKILIPVIQDFLVKDISPCPHYWIKWQVFFLNVKRIYFVNIVYKEINLIILLLTNITKR